jgi:MYXO-CTERM domain-containing protein
MACSAAAGFAALLSAQSAGALDGACPFGVNAHQASDAALDLVEAAGISWVRFDMNWLQFEPSQGTFDWTEADRFIGHATAKGLHVFVTVAYTPSWAVGVPCNDADPNPVNRCLNAYPANTADWTAFVTAAVTRYGADVKHWGMWNEPNLDHFFKGSRDDYVTRILVPGSDAVHAACGDCLVLGPELANLRNAHWDADEGTCLGGNCIFNGWNYSLIQVLDAAAPSIDIITHHKYGDPASGWWSSILDGTFEVIKVTDGVKEITDEKAPGKPVWITEVGWEAEPDGGFTNAYAASQLTALYQGLPAVHAGTLAGVTNQPWPELQKIFWYDLSDDPNGYSWGLLDSALAIKPQYTAYQDLVAAAGPCTSPSGSGGGGQGGMGPGAGGSGGNGNGGSAGETTTTTTTAGPIGSGGASNDGGDDGDGGCACRTAPRSGSPLAWMLALGLVTLARARRR